MSRSLLLLIFV